METPLEKTARCDACNAEFRFEIYHSGFSEIIYAYCDRCGMLLVIETSDHRVAPQRCRMDWARSIIPSLESTLPPCECGGRFSGATAPRCPKCLRPLDPVAFAEAVEAAAPANQRRPVFPWQRKRTLWRWQRNWQGLYCICIAGRKRDLSAGD